MYPLEMAQQRITPTPTRTATATTVPTAVETAIPTVPLEDSSTVASVGDGGGGGVGLGATDAGCSTLPRNKCDQSI